MHGGKELAVQVNIFRIQAKPFILIVHFDRPFPFLVYVREGKLLCTSSAAVDGSFP